jgi:hypothetical protein
MPSSKQDVLYWMARNLTEALDGTDIMELSAPALNALERLFDQVTFERREQLEARRKQLWRASAIVVDPAVLAALARTEIVSGDIHPDWISDVALVRRTDTGQYYIVSTNDEETFVWPADEHGERSGTDNIYSVSGRGMTRAQAIRAIDETDAERLRPGFSWMWDDNDDNDDDDTDGTE